MATTKSTHAAHLNVPAPPYSMPGDRREALLQQEWLLTTGHGAYAMGTPAGVNRRKYHALLIASANPPVERLATLNAIREQVIVGQGARRRIIELSTFLRTGHRFEPDGLVHLESFSCTRSEVRWHFEHELFTLTKTLRLGHQINACAVRYRLVPLSQAISIRLSPCVTIRDFHNAMGPGEPAQWRAEHLDCGVLVHHGRHELALRAEGAEFYPEQLMERSLDYPLEAARGYPAAEDYFIPGRFEQHVEPGAPHTLTIAGALAPDSPDPGLFDADEKGRHLKNMRNRFAQIHSDRGDLLPLVEAADDYLIRRIVDGRELRSVIAGYPWFADWGRDTMISLPGLMYATGRHDDAFACLSTFARHVSQGMIPNRFDDDGGPPHYNTVDASLWFLHACREYVRATHDRAGFDRELRSACTKIIEHYGKGTRYGITMDPEDALIMAGDESTQLTWMDAKRDGVVFTPRHGKAVEINALWHHGLLCIADLIRDDNEIEARDLWSLAQRVGASFIARFWCESEQRLHDCLMFDEQDGWRPTPDIRPNQIFAVSLEYSPLDARQKKAVVANVRTHLFTDRGLRTLAPDDPGYAPKFKGDMMARDRAYHNGTVWPWLIGPYAEALLRADDFSADSRAEARRAIEPIIATMNQGCLGQIAEIFDAEPTDGVRLEEGCTAQAWSVAEVLRIALLIDSAT